MSKVKGTRQTLACMWLLACLYACKRSGPFSDGRILAAAGACEKDVRAALEKKWPVLKEGSAWNAVSPGVEFDCHEASLVDTLDGPVSSAEPVMKDFVEFVKKVPLPTTRYSTELINPYCRKDNDIYGPFCMASDIAAARAVYDDPELLAKLPAAVRAIDTALANGSADAPLDYIAVVEPVFAGLERAKVRSTVLAAFLGLDDNGVQVDRLKANLLRFGRLGDYAAVFPWASQYVSFPAIEGHAPTAAFLALLMGTRTGRARPAGVKPEATQTYKAYSGAFLGCAMAQAKKPRLVAEAEGWLIGYVYQLIKLRGSVGKSMGDFLADAKHYEGRGRETADLMKAGVGAGYSRCAR